MASTCSELLALGSSCLLVLVGEHYIFMGYGEFAYRTQSSACCDTDDSFPSGLFSMLLILGCLGIPQRTSSSQSTKDAASLAKGAIMLVWALCYQLTVGTVCYSLVAEMSTRRLQIKTVALGRAMYNVVAIICNVLTPYMLNPGEWYGSSFFSDF